MTTRTRSIRGCRATALVAVVILMLMVNLAVIGLVMGGARDHSTTIWRVDSARAVYAADSGMHLAVREVVLNMDADGDGTIGSISDDGNPSNDPLIGGARTFVQRNLDTLDIRGRGDLASRRVQLQIAVGGSTGSIAIYGDHPANAPVTRQWTSAWSAPTIISDVGGRPRWFTAVACPTRIEIAVLVGDQRRDVNALIYDGSTWSSALEFSTDNGTRDHRPHSIAYEQVSGRALAVYRVGSSSSIFYRTWNGTAWSGQFSTSNLSSDELRFLKLIPRPGSNEIMLLSLDDDRELVAMIWSGSSWGNKVILDSDAKTESYECMDAAYESVSGDAMVIWGRDGSNSVRYRTWISGAWGPVTVGPNMGGEAHWVRIAPSSTSDRLMLLTLDDSSDVNVALWSGSAWGAAVELESNASYSDHRCADVAFEPAGTRAIAVYGEGSVTSPRYRLFDGTSWSTEASAPSAGAASNSFRLIPAGAGQEILSLSATASDTLRFMRWTGAAFVDGSLLEGDLSGNDRHEAYALVRSAQTTPKIVAIQMIQP